MGLTWDHDDELLLAPREAPGEVEQQRDARAVQLAHADEVNHEAQGLVRNCVRDGHLEFRRI
jgi:hypothetical protein